jgi:hypothetical protein
MTTKDDEIVGEIRRHREAHAASLDYDVKRIMRDLQRQERESGRRVVTRPTRKPFAGRRAIIGLTRPCSRPRIARGLMGNGMPARFACVST